MIIEIDQSGRVEYTSHRTVIADSLEHAVYVNTSTKRIIQALFRKSGKPRLFVYETFALLVALVIKRSFSKTQNYMIDTEYPGKSDVITRYILLFSQRIGFPIDPHQISFGRVKEGSASDKLAHLEFQRIRKARKIEMAQILTYLLP